ncbi:MAG TPA: hypothetical protein VH116_10080 [Gemmatimonadales bacterium]|nr:hypothetical protein [Gemmatimonadales bacterium]
MALGSVLATAAAAQTPHEPVLVFAAYAGVITGHQLWTVDRQPVCQLTGGSSGTFMCSTQYDTIALTRTVESSLVAGLTMTYFPRRALGLQFDVAYLGLPANTRCSAVAVSSSPNQQLCDNIAAGPSGSSVAFDLGAVLRHPPGASSMSPYVRAGFGILAYSGSLVEVVGSFDQGANTYSRSVIADASPRHVSASLSLGGGLMVSLSPGYAFRLELRDVYTSLARVLGPANDLGVAPTGTQSYHHLLLTMGLGVVLEQKRGRRY